ncbi:rhodanese-like domain-containing protein [Aromatoleum aromaticum]|uniref:rhodanese-like domain-containing protein n=1 Tax=Aromatoleum aromaticum TaxID=551760 RepID=UPI0002E9FE4D|nr:rhodanese-like domain-containing protein [Aromatoleum aromaticum]NMG53115.1 rhodanese-like domain-containing protein [Aromatoleum aromaticum]
MEFLQQNWYWAALAVASGSWLLFDFARAQGDKSQVSPIEATLLINREEAIVIDIRDQAEYSRGHIPNARHIPQSDLERRSAELAKFKDRPLIVYCFTGARSSAAVATLRKAGFEKLFNLRGGLVEWEKAGQPVSRKRK